MSKRSILVPLVGALMVLFSQCTKESLLQGDPEASQLSLKAGEMEESTPNNLSFPVLTADGFSITALTGGPVWGTPYTGPYTGLTMAERAIVTQGTWYAQKDETNKWQADFRTANGSDFVKFIDWGDMIESVNPKMGFPVRIELSLFVDVHAGQTLKGYVMAPLANPSSSTELQGTNKATYDAYWASLASNKTGICIQQLDPTLNPQWDPGVKAWKYSNASIPVTRPIFALELNVGGKYIYGISQGGWRPSSMGIYRITFYLNDDSEIKFDSEIKVGNYVDNTNTIGAIGEEEGGAGKPEIDKVNKISYVDVEVVSGSGGGRGGSSGRGGSGSGGMGGKAGMGSAGMGHRR